MSAGADTAPIRWNSTQGQYNAGYIALYKIFGTEKRLAQCVLMIFKFREKWLKIESYFLDLLQARFLKRSDTFFELFFL